jgi:hypothetical protein
LRDLTNWEDARRPVMDPTNLPARIEALEKHVEMLEQMIAHLSARMKLKFEWTTPGSHSSDGTPETR